MMMSNSDLTTKSFTNPFPLMGFQGRWFYLIFTDNNQRTRELDSEALLFGAPSNPSNDASIFRISF